MKILFGKFKKKRSYMYSKNSTTFILEGCPPPDKINFAAIAINNIGGSRTIGGGAGSYTGNNNNTNFNNNSSNVNLNDSQQQNQYHNMQSSTRRPGLTQQNVNVLGLAGQQSNVTKNDITKFGSVLHTGSSGSSVRVLTRGEAICFKTGNPYDRQCSKPCWWHRMNFDGIAMGIPMRIETTDGKMIVYMDGYFCSYSCVYRRILEEEKKLPQFRDHNIINSKSVLFQLFKEEFPNDILEAAGDWEFLDTVGNGTVNIRNYVTKLTGVRIRVHPNYHFMPTTIMGELMDSTNPEYLGASNILLFNSLSGQGYEEGRELNNKSQSNKRHAANNTVNNDVGNVLFSQQRQHN